MKKYRVLHELYIALEGYAGIPQEVRTLFNLFSKSDSIDVDGFLYTHDRRISKLDAATRENSRFESLLNTNIFLHDALNHEHKFAWRYRIQKKLIATLGLSHRVSQFKKHFSDHKRQLFTLDPSFREIIWRNIFKKSIPITDRESILNNPFYYSNLSWQDIRSSAQANYKISLDTSQYDFAVFPDIRPISVSPGTQKIIRYHDSLPLLCPDFFTRDDLQVHLDGLHGCKQDSFFVCNSDYTRKTLLTLLPELENKSTVIPPISMPYQPAHNEKRLRKVLLTRISRRALGDDTHARMTRLLDTEKQFDYILSVATLEPRKNYISLIKAWEKFCLQYNQNIKLIIVANPGWLAESTEQVMRPYIEMGKIIHLAKVPAEELNYLYSHAKLFVTTSYLEGFGSPAIEALQCDCPVLASDNPAHRFALGQAADYCDPYSIDSITTGMAKSILTDTSTTICNEKRQKQKDFIARYTKEPISAQWMALFESLGSTHAKKR